MQLATEQRESCAALAFFAAVSFSVVVIIFGGGGNFKCVEVFELAEVRHPVS